MKKYFNTSFFYDIINIGDSVIKQYVDYKMNSYNKILQSTIISPSEKKNAMDDYSRFMSYFKFDEYGRPIITKKVAREMMKLAWEGVIPFVIDEYDIGINIVYVLWIQKRSLGYGLDICAINNFCYNAKYCSSYFNRKYGCKR